MFQLRIDGSARSLAPEHGQLVAINLVTGAVFAVMFLPLARRLRFGTRTRFLAVFVPLYWIGLTSNLVEAAVDTTLPALQLVVAAIVFAIPYATPVDSLVGVANPGGGCAVCRRR